MASAPFKVSILMLTYRMEATIRPALEGALAQTVPCEIIVSYDCFDDGTFELAQELVANYRVPHSIRVRRN